MKKDEMDSKLKNAFNDLQNIPPRDPQAAARGRANFLKQAAVLRQPVSREVNRRQNWVSSTIFPLFQRKERFHMLNSLIAVILAVVVLFGGSGATVAAAQGSLPDQALYLVKTWSEDAVLSLTGSTQTRLQYVLDFSDRRVLEMTRLLADGKSIPAGVETRLQNELDLVLELTAGMSDTQALQQLQMIIQRADAQYQTLSMLMSGAPQSDGPLLLRAHARLQEQVQLAAMGESDMSGFRMQIRQRFQYRGGTGGTTGTTPGSSGPMNSTSMPGSGGNGNGYGPGMNQPTLTPGTNQPVQMPGVNQMTATPVLKCTSTPMMNCTGTPMPYRTPGSGGGSGHMP
jgi:uncharacterized membrane protein YgcG